MEQKKKKRRKMNSTSETCGAPSSCTNKFPRGDEGEKGQKHCLKKLCLNTSQN